jgi:hypothetical protein
MNIKRIGGLAALLVACAAVGLLSWKNDPRHRSEFDPKTEDIQPSKPKYILFTDDDPSAKNPGFDPELVDSRLVGDSPDNPWQINASAATIRLDVPDLMGEHDAPLQHLFPSYADAVRKLKKEGYQVLPSINMLDGKAKQFDDGLYAELDAGLTMGKLKAYSETVSLVRAIMDRLDRSSAAYAFLWGALKVGGFLDDAHRAEPAGVANLIDAFESDEVQSKPIGFYTWSDELKRTFRFLRFLMIEWRDRKGAPDQTAAVLAANPELLKQYQRLLDFYARLTNPYSQLSFLPLTDPANAGRDLLQLWKKAELALPWPPTAHFLPYSGSKETRLFNRFFSGGLPLDVDLMAELVKAIRSGRVDLKPAPNSGWYDHQVYALETFLLPERGAESSKLILTKKYKERMLQAFSALITKRRETHARQLGPAKGESEVPKTHLSPHLRVEPNPTFFLRTARAYAFLENFLTATLPGETLKSLRGRMQGGQRPLPLAEELVWMKSYFYGLHLISCEDIGMRPEIAKDEPVDAAACTKVASDWLANWAADPDLAVDTRVIVPIFKSSVTNRTMQWATLGVRGAKLEAAYVKGPSWRPTKADAANREWQEISSWQCKPSNYVILVDEFAEFALKGLRVLTREELRTTCDREGTKEAIVKALER